MRTWLKTAAWLALATGQCVGAEATIRPLAGGLHGDELLVEVEKVGPGEEPPGIYAVDEDGTPKLVLVFGRRPSWAPGRERFCFWRGTELWSADVSERRSRLIGDLGGLLFGPEEFGLGPSPMGTWSPTTGWPVFWRVLPLEPADGARSTFVRDLARVPYQVGPGGGGTDA